MYFCTPFIFFSYSPICDFVYRTSNTGMKVKNSIKEVFHVMQIKHLEDVISSFLPYGWSCIDIVYVIYQDKYFLVSVHPSPSHEFLKIFNF